MSPIQYDQARGKPRGVGYFPQLSGLAAAIAGVSARLESPERGLTGKEFRTDDDHAERLAKRQAKLARRAKAAGFPPK